LPERVKADRNEDFYRLHCATKATEPYGIAEVARSAGEVFDRGFAARPPPPQGILNGAALRLRYPKFWAVFFAQVLVKSTKSCIIKTEGHLPMAVSPLLGQKDDRKPGKL
jgi:hypothetical protein